MWINPETHQVFTTHSEIRSAFSSVSFPSSMSDEDIAYVGLLPVTQESEPAHNPVTQIARKAQPAMTSKGHWEQSWEVVDLDAEVIAANQAAQAEADSKAIDAKYNALWSAADKYVAGYISGVAIGLLTVGLLQAKPKAQAVTSWSSSVWAEYYVRKSLITLTSDDDLDFSALGPMPHSVPELQVEVGL